MVSLQIWPASAFPAATIWHEAENCHRAILSLLKSTCKSRHRFSKSKGHWDVIAYSTLPKPCSQGAPGSNSGTGAGGSCWLWSLSRCCHPLVGHSEIDSGPCSYVWFNFQLIERSLLSSTLLVLWTTSEQSPSGEHRGWNPPLEGTQAPWHSVPGSERESALPSLLDLFSNRRLLPVKTGPRA